MGGPMVANECCDGYICSDFPPRCIEECGYNRNSGRNKLIQCESNSDCCDGFQCNEKSKKCIRGKRRSSAWFKFDEFDVTYNLVLMFVTAGIIMIFCGMFAFFCHRKRKRTAYKEVAFDVVSDSDQTENEEAI